MDTNIAYYYFKAQEKKYEFLFRYTDPEIDLDRIFRFNLRKDEKIEDLTNKVKSVVGKTIKRRQDDAESKTEENNSQDDTSNMKIRELVLLKKDKTRTNTTNSGEINIDVKFLENDNTLNNITCEDYNNIEGKLQFVIENKKYSVIVNIPRIINLNLPKIMYAGFPIYPSEFEGMLFDKNNSTFSWSKSKDKINWIKIANTFSYASKNEDIGYYLKFGCIPRNEKDTGVLVETISSEIVQEFQDYCPFERRHKYTKTYLSNKSFRVLSYNLLADHYCKSENAKASYHYCPLDKLSIDYRKQLLLKEIKGYHADILCLQEVDYKIFKTYYRPELQKMKYKGFYAPKESKPEGLAFFFNTKRFRLVHLDTIVIGKEIKKHRSLVKFWKNIANNEAAANSLIDQNTILQVAALKSLEHKEMVFVANTHLFFRPDASHIRLLQAAASTAYIEHFMLLPQVSKKNHHESLIYCGDFNSTPKSGVYKFFTEGLVTKDAADWTSNQEEIVKNVTVQHKRKMDSACGTPEYTNYTEDFKACLDYIFYEKNNLSISQMVPLLTEDEMSKNIAIPNVGIPSDHVALVVDFNWM